MKSTYLFYFIILKDNYPTLDFMTQISNGLHILDVSSSVKPTYVNRIKMHKIGIKYC